MDAINGPESSLPNCLDLWRDNKFHQYDALAFLAHKWTILAAERRGKSVKLQALIENSLSKKTASNDEVETKVLNNFINRVSNKFGDPRMADALARAMLENPPGKHYELPKDVKGTTEEKAKKLLQETKRRNKKWCEQLTISDKIFKIADAYKSSQNGMSVRNNKNNFRGFSGLRDAVSEICYRRFGLSKEDFVNHAAKFNVDQIEDFSGSFACFRLMAGNPGHVLKTRLIVFPPLGTVDFSFFLNLSYDGAKNKRDTTGIVLPLNKQSHLIGSINLMGDQYGTKSMVIGQFGDESHIANGLVLTENLGEQGTLASRLVVVPETKSGLKIPTNSETVAFQGKVEEIVESCREYYGTSDLVKHVFDEHTDWLGSTIYGHLTDAKNDRIKDIKERLYNFDLSAVLSLVEKKLDDSEITQLVYELRNAVRQLD